MKDRIYIATVCEEHGRLAAEYGLGIELDQFCTADNMEGGKLTLCEKEIAELAGLLHSSPLHEKKPRFILHAPFNELYPAAIDPRARALAMERFDMAADLARKYGAKKMVIHSGYVPLVYYKEWHIDRSVEFWKEFMDRQPEDFQMVLENVMDDEPYMIAEVLEKVAHPNVKACFDTGHAACISKTPIAEWLSVLKPYLGHLHIHNNDGSHDWHRPIMEGVVDMGEVMEFARTQCGDDVTITIESLQATSSVTWLKERGYI